MGPIHAKIPHRFWEKEGDHCRSPGTKELNSRLVRSYGWIYKRKEWPGMLTLKKHSPCDGNRWGREKKKSFQMKVPRVGGRSKKYAPGGSGPAPGGEVKSMWMPSAWGGHPGKVGHLRMKRLSVVEEGESRTESALNAGKISGKQLCERRGSNFCRKKKGRKNLHFSAINEGGGRKVANRQKWTKSNVIGK